MVNDVVEIHTQVRDQRRFAETMTCTNAALYAQILLPQHTLWSAIQVKGTSTSSVSMHMHAYNTVKGCCTWYAYLVLTPILVRCTRELP